MQIPDDIWCEILSRLDQPWHIVKMRVNKHLAVLAPRCIYTVDMGQYPKANGRLLPNITSLITRIASLKHFTNVTNLDITNCALHNISHMTKLKKLTIDGNDHVCDADIVGLTNLTTLEAYATIISDVGIMPLTNLTKLSIGCCKITNKGPYNLAKLQSLLLYESEITDISGLVELKELYLNQESQISDNSISKLTNLTVLDLGDNTLITDAGISGLTQLLKLGLCCNGVITDAGVCTLTSLVTLVARYSSISFAPVSLTKLDAKDSEISADSIRGLTNLTTLAINACAPAITDLTKLTKLTLTGDICDNTILRKLTNLRILDMCAIMNGQWDFSHMHNLDTLYVCAGTDVGIGAWPRRIIYHESDPLSLLPY